MSSFSAQRRPDLPSSPWATRFEYTSVTYVESDQNHSSLAPVYPRIDDPTHYDQDGESLDAAGPANNTEIDRLFRHEQIQIRELQGIRTWEAVVLSRLLLFSSATGVVSGGHRLGDDGAAKEASLASYARDKIKVEETAWLPFFRKDRWFDWIDSAPFNRGQGQQQEAKTWSVDDASIWGSVTASLELANRIIDCLLEERNETLYAILWGRIEDWDAVKDQFGSPQILDSTEGRRVLIDYSAEQRLAQARAEPKTQWDAAAVKTARESRDRMVKLLEGLLWGFSPIIRLAGANAITEYIPRNRTPKYTTFVHIATETAELLKSPDLTLAELCKMQVLLAVDIVHELMHAVMQNRDDPSDTYEGNRWDKSLRPPMLEPYWNAEGVIEIGCEMERRVFGGMTRNKPTLKDSEWTRTEVRFPIPIVATVTSYPHVGCTNFDTTTLSSTFRLAGHVNTVDHVPLLWHSMMLSEEFWSRADPKSVNSFHRARILIAQSPNQADNAGPSAWQPPILQDISTQGSENAFDAAVVAAWKEKQAVWASIRAGWYDDSKRLWLRSPWAHISLRDIYQGFPEAFAKRDEAKCASIAMELYSVVAMDTLEAHRYRHSLPKPDGQFIRTRWSWHVLGLLMMASMPIRIDEPIGEEILKRFGPYKYTPSREAARAGLAAPVSLALQPELNQTTARTSFFYRDDGSPILQLLEGSIVNQSDYLAQAHGILVNAQDTEAIIHRELYWALVNAHQAIEDARHEIAEEYPNGADKYKWLPVWAFQMPEYSPTIMAHDVASGQWGTFAPGS